VRVNPEFYRSLEIHERVGNPARALEKLGWRPATTLEELCRIMVEADLRRNTLIT
jgi:GDPmannose 4,6-dehydratase